MPRCHQARNREAGAWRGWGQGVAGFLHWQDINLLAPKQCQILFWWAPKSVQMVTATMELKDAYFLEGKL